MLERIKALYAPEHMIDPSLVKGDIPSARETYGRFLRLAWPSAVESVLIALVSAIDTMMVGTLGSAAISAVGICTQPKFLLMAPIISLNVGVTAVVARRRGAKDMDGARRTLKQAVLISFIFSSLMAAAALIFAKPLLSLAGAQDEYIASAVIYFRIIMGGQFFACLGMTMNAAQRGFGNTKIAMRSNIVANLVNIVFNYLLINGIWIFPRLGVVGAAIATAMCGMVAFIMALSSLLKRNENHLSLICRAKWRFDKLTVSSIAKVSSSALVEQVFLRFGFFTYGMLVAKLGTVPFAAHQICMTLMHISFAFADGMGVAATSLVGQSLGAERPDHAMIFGKVGQRCSMSIGIVLSIIFVLFRREIIMLFTTEQAVIEIGASVMLVLAGISLAQTSQVVISGCLRGAGDSRYVAVSSFLSVGIIRPGAAFLLCYPLGLGLAGAWLGTLLDQTMRLVLNYIRFQSGKWMRIKL